MEILFKNETEIGKEEKKIFNKFMLLKYNVFNFLSIFFNPLFLFVIAICGLFIWLFIWLIWELIKEGVWAGALVMFAVGVFGVIKSKNDDKKKKDLQENIVFKYEFYDEYIVIHANNTSNTATSTDKLYFKEIVLKDICKYSGYIFLTQSRKSSWFINENNFTIGNKEEFEKYIQNKFNKKLKCYH